MRKSLLTIALIGASILGRSQFTQDDLIYYVGEGPDTAVFVVDFLDETVDSSYAWGVLFDESLTVTGGDLLETLSDEEDQFSRVLAGAFLSDIHFNGHSGVGGAPNYWGTWSKTEGTEWVSNSGLGEVLANGDWFGCSYTDFSPAVAPGEPIPAYESSKLSVDDVQYWVGTGDDSAVFVIDFVTAPYAEIATYAWGYLFDGTTTGGDILAALNTADVNLTVDAGAFLNDIEYNGLAGIGGDPHYWGTFSGTNLSDWTLNAGLSTVVEPGDWFGCSYDAWQPRRPFYPIPAYDADLFVQGDVPFEVGSGENRTVIVIDFDEWTPGSSYAFGYSFETETVTAEEALLDLAEFYALPLEVNIAGGFLNDISYFGEDGIGGAPYYWSTWSAPNASGWAINTGIGEELSDGDWFGCSYTSFSPATPPSLCENAIYVFGLNENDIQFEMYPNPANESVVISVNEESALQIIDLSGRAVLVDNLTTGQNFINIADLSSGIYNVLLTANGVTQASKLVKK